MKSTIDVILFWVSFWSYLGSFVSFTISSALRKKAISGFAALLFIIGFTALTAGITARTIISTHPSFATMYEYALVVSWIASLIFIITYARTKNPVYGLMVSPVVVVVMVMASLLPKDITKQLMPALKSYWFYIHVTLAAVSEGAFAVSAGAAILYLVKERGRVQDDSPSLEAIEEIVSRSIRIAYPLFTIGALFAGAIWARSAWGSFWSWDPKETGSLVVWLYYTLVLHQEFRGRWRKRKLAFAAIAGFAIIIFSFIGNLFFGGLHSYV